jgi:hypothetical protein
MTPISSTTTSTRLLRGNDRALGSRQGPPPTDEIGVVAQAGMSGWAAFAYDELETVPELQFPESIRMYNNMRNDSQIEGLHAGCTWPILRYKFMIDPNGCDPAKVKKLAADINIPIKGDDPTAPKPRTKDRFVLRTHLRDVFKTLLSGFYPFEQVGRVKDDDGLWHLRKLAPRPPITVQEIRTSPTGDGGLVSIVQNISGPMGFGAVPEIPVDRLVMYVWEKEGANWHGRSMLRAIYRNWLIKDRLLRVDAVKHERNGMGVPVAFGAPGMTNGELQALARLAQSYKAGESAGAAFPYQTDLKLLGVQGSLPDTIASINLHNEEMARRWLMMFLQLGSTLHGSRSLGKDFVDYFQLAQEHVANWALDTFNEHVVEDWWDWNYGEDEEYAPFVMYERDDDPRFAAADLALMIQNKVIQVDDEIEQAVREAMDLPAFDSDNERTYLPGNSPEEQMQLMQENKIGDQPNQPSTQPGKANPDTPPEDQSTAPANKDKVSASSQRLPAATLSSPAASSGANGLDEWRENPDAI